MPLLLTCIQSCTAAAELQDLIAASSAAVIADLPETMKKRKEASARSMWKLAADVHCSLPLSDLQPELLVYFVVGWQIPSKQHDVHLLP